MLGVIASMLAMITGCSVESRFYKPSHSEPVIPAGYIDLALEGPSGGALHGWLAPAPSIVTGQAVRRPVIVFCHGNRATIDFFAPRLEALRVAADASLLLFSYRGYGRSSSIEHVTRASTVADARAAVTAAFDRPEVDPDAVFVMGYSMGGVAALAAGADEPRVRGVIVGGTYARADEALDDSGYGWAKMFIGGEHDPADSIARMGKRPVLIFHGALDTTPGPHHAYELAAAAARAKVPVEVLIVPNAGHYTAADAESGVLEVVARFVQAASTPADARPGSPE